MESRNQAERMLVFEPHPDDMALQLGGSVFKWIQDGKDVACCTLTTGNRSTFDPEVSMDEIAATMLEEHAMATARLGLPPGKVVQWDYDDLGLDPATHRAGMLERMVRLIRELRPTTVITMDPRNMLNEENPDHRLVAMTGFEAAALAAYPRLFPGGPPPHFVGRVLLYMSPEPNAFVDIEGEPLEAKIEAGSMYRSQLELMTTEIDARLRCLGLDPDLEDVPPADLWNAVCTSMAEETAAEANLFYQANPRAKPPYPMEQAEAFRIYYPGAVEKLRDLLPKQCLVL